MRSGTFFQRILSSLTVGEIADELAPPLDPRNTFEDVSNALIDAGLEGKDNWFCLVKEGKHYIGYTCPDSDYNKDADHYSPVRDFLEPIRPEQIIAFSFPVLEVIPILLDEFYLFVQQGNQITHILTYPCLDKIPFRQCLLSLMLEAEYYMQKIICINQHGANEKFKLLSLERQYKACQLYMMASELSRSTNQIIDFTTFIDKVTIFQKDEELKKMLPFTNKKSAQRFFKKMEDIRNAVAHGRTLIPEIQDLSHFTVFIQEVNALTQHLANSYLKLNNG